MADGVEIAGVLQPGGAAFSNFAQTLMRNRQAKQEAQAAAQKEQAEGAEKQRKAMDDLGEYGMKMVDTKDLFTGDAKLDPMVNQKITGLRAEMANYINQSGGKISKMDLYNTFFPKISELSKYRQKAQLFQQNKKAILEQYKGIAGTDPGMISSLMDRAFYNTGNIDEMNPDENILLETIEANKDQWVTTDDAIAKWAGNQGIGEKQVAIKNRQGNTTTFSTETYKLPKYAEVTENGVVKPKGEKVYFELGQDGTTEFVATGGMAYEAEMFLGQIFGDEEGGVNLLDPEVFTAMVEDKGARVKLEAEAQRLKKQYEQQTGRRIPEGPVSNELLYRALAYKKLEQYGKDAVRLRNEKLQINVGGGRSGGGSGRGSGQPTATERRQAELENMYTQAAKKAATQQGLPAGWLKNKTNIKPKIGGKRTPIDVIDVTPFFPKGRFNTGGTGGARIYVEEGKPGEVWVIENPADPMSEPKKLVGDQVDAYFEVMKNANAVQNYNPDFDAGLENEVNARLNDSDQVPAQTEEKPTGGSAIPFFDLGQKLLNIFSKKK